MKPGYLTFRDEKGNVQNPTGADTDWQNEMLRNGLAQNYNVSVRGGTEIVSYSISYNHSDEKGIFLGNHYTQDNARAKMNLKKYIFHFDANMALKVTQSKQPQYSLKEMYMISPLIPVHDPDQPSGYGLADMKVNDVNLQLPSNRNVAADNHFRDSKSNRYNMLANIGITANFTSWLKFKTAYSYNGIYMNSSYHSSAYTSDFKGPVRFPYNSKR